MTTGIEVGAESPAQQGEDLAVWSARPLGDTGTMPASWMVSGCTPLDDAEPRGEGDGEGGGGHPVGDVEGGDGLRGGQATGGRLLTARGLRTRALLLEAAEQVFETSSFNDTRISDITARAGVASGTFYTYFDSKEAIFREVATKVLGEMRRAPRRDPDNVARDPVRDIEYSSREYFLACLRHAAIARSIEELTMRGDEGVARVRRSSLVASVKRVERWIRNLQKSGTCDDAIEPWTTAMALHTMNVRVAYDHLLAGGAATDEDAAALARAVTRIWARTVGLERVEPG